MAIKNQIITSNYALYHGDCCEVIKDIPSDSIHLSIYSPPFCGLYNYSSSPRDMSNNDSYEDFFEHYGFLIREMNRVTMPGRFTAVHCADVRTQGANVGGLIDFSGDIIRAHQEAGWEYWDRYHVWKEPLGVRLRTMAKGLTHKTIVDDSTLCDNAAADYLLTFRKKGENPVPVTHPTGLDNYAGSRKMPSDIQGWRNHKGKQTENRYSHWIWRQYASAFWDDIRLGRVLPYKEGKDDDDEKHVHPLQLDVIERMVVLRSNEGETVFTPFMGVGSETYGSIINGRKAIGVELKDTYFRQAVKNMSEARRENDQPDLFDDNA